MNPPIKRLLALVGSVVAGLFGTIVLASPAQAHHVTYDSSAVCLPSGEYKITWEIKNGNFSNRYAKITRFDVDPDTPVTGLSRNLIILPDRTATGYQVVPGNTRFPQLHATIRWFDRNNHDTGNKQDIDFTAKDVVGKCKPKPECVSAANAQFAHTFNGATGDATVELKGELPLCKDNKQDFLLVSYYAPSSNPTSAVPLYKFDHAVGTVTDTVKKIVLNVDLPPCYTQVDLVWGGASELIDPIVANGARYNDKILGSSGLPGSRSQGTPSGRATYNGAGTQNAECTTPAATFVPDCGGAVKVNLANTGKFTATFSVKATNFDKTVPVEAGKAVPVDVPANAGKITVTEQGKEVGSYTWKLPEDANCPPPSLVAESTCDNFTLKVSNPEGNVPAEATATYGTQTQKKTVAAGKTETFVFLVGSVQTAKVTFTGLGLELEGLYEKPDNCDTLPKTGPNTMTYIASGTGLAMLGGLVFFFARRRTVKLRNLASS